MSAFFYREPAKLIVDIIQKELGLQSGQVLLTNQKYEIPTDGLFVVVSYVGPGKVISNQNEWIDDGAGGLIEVQTVSMLQMLQIDMMAFNDPVGGNQARQRMLEIPMALRSVYSQNQQDAYSIKLASNIGPIMDVSSLEETEMLTRFTMTIQAFSVAQKQKAVDSYSSFEVKAYSDVVKPPFADFDASVEPALAP